MAGHALAIAEAFPDAAIVGVEPDTAADFQQSLATGERVRVDLPTGICDGLLSYDVGECNWPILQRLVSQAVTVPVSSFPAMVIAGSPVPDAISRTSMSGEMPTSSIRRILKVSLLGFAALAASVQPGLRFFQ